MRDRGRVPGLALALLAAIAGPSPSRAQSERGLSLADLAPYRSALDGKPGGPAVPATFRDLWDQPERFRGRRVRVEGRVARRFRQGAFGTFPALVELWAVSPAGDPLCLVFPPGRGPDAGPTAGSSVVFEGIFLRKLQYEGSDAPRLAPLIAGDRPPVVTAAATPAPARAAAAAPARRDWVLGLAAAGLVALALARQHLKAPPRRRGRDLEPPRFLEDA